MSAATLEVCERPHERARDSRCLQLRSMIAEGLTFAECVKIFTEQHDAFDHAAVGAAQEDRRVVSNDELEVDDEAVTSRGDDDSGCFVMSWLYVTRAQISAFDSSVADAGDDENDGDDE